MAAKTPSTAEQCQMLRHNPLRSTNALTQCSSTVIRSQSRHAAAGRASCGQQGSPSVCLSVPADRSLGAAHWEAGSPLPGMPGTAGLPGSHTATSGRVASKGWHPRSVCRPRTWDGGLQNLCRPSSTSLLLIASAAACANSADRCGHRLVVCACHHASPQSSLAGAVSFGWGCLQKP